MIDNKSIHEFKLLNKFQIQRKDNFLINSITKCTNYCGWPHTPLTCMYLFVVNLCANVCMFVIINHATN